MVFLLKSFLVGLVKQDGKLICAPITSVVVRLSRRFCSTRKKVMIKGESIFSRYRNFIPVPDIANNKNNPFLDGFFVPVSCQRSNV